MPEKKKNPSATPIFGQPDDTWDLINKYGTYNIQPTAESENEFPEIAEGLAEDRTYDDITKDELKEYREEKYPD